MTLDEMQTFIREIGDDASSTRWTQTLLYNQLNSSARTISQDVELMACFPRILTATQTLSVVSGTTAYTLNTDYVSTRRFVWTDPTPDIECRQIEENEFQRWTEQQRTFDDEGRPVFYLSTNTSGVNTFNFPYDPQMTMTIVHHYQKLLPTVSSGSSSFELPSILHELVPLRVLNILLPSDERSANGAAFDYAERRKQMVQFLRQTRRDQYVMVADGLVG